MMKPKDDLFEKLFNLTMLGVLHSSNDGGDDQSAMASEDDKLVEPMSKGAVIRRHQSIDCTSPIEKATTQVRSPGETRLLLRTKQETDLLPCPRRCAATDSPFAASNLNSFRAVFEASSVDPINFTLLY